MKLQGAQSRAGIGQHRRREQWAWEEVGAEGDRAGELRRLLKTRPPSQSSQGQPLWHLQVSRVCSLCNTHSAWTPSTMLVKGDSMLVTENPQ